MPEASMLKYQAAWYSAFIAVYIWFLYWISYDFFVLQNPIAEINAVNYVGSIASIAFIWAGTKIWKRKRVEAQKTQQKPLQPPQPKMPRKATQQPAPANSTCAHYLGYLHQRQKQQEIPTECLTCKKVIQCFSSTKTNS